MSTQSALLAYGYYNGVGNGAMYQGPPNTTTIVKTIFVYNGASVQQDIWLLFGRAGLLEYGRYPIPAAAGVQLDLWVIVPPDFQLGLKWIVSSEVRWIISGTKLPGVAEGTPGFASDSLLGVGVAPLPYDYETALF